MSAACKIASTSASPVHEGTLFNGLAVEVHVKPTDDSAEPHARGASEAPEVQHPEVRESMPPLEQNAGPLPAYPYWLQHGLVSWGGQAQVQPVGGHCAVGSCGGGGGGGDDDGVFVEGGGGGAVGGNVVVGGGAVVPAVGAIVCWMGAAVDGVGPALAIATSAQFQNSSGYVVPHAESEVPHHPAPGPSPLHEPYVVGHVRSVYPGGLHEFAVTYHHCSTQC